MDLMNLVLYTKAIWILGSSIVMLLVTIWSGIYIGALDHPWLRRACAIIYGDD